MDKNVPAVYLQNKITGEIGNAAGIFYPTNTAEVVECVKTVNEKKQKLITIGGFTGLTGATFASQGEVLVCLKQMRQIIELDQKTLTLTVQAGVTLAEIQTYLEQTPYFYAPDPGSKEATIGGTAATNAGGMRAIKYGVTRDNIRGMEVVLADGTLILVGGLNNKASSGYDLKDLFIGSEGTLGIITKLQLKLRPKPVTTQSVLIGFNDLNELAPAVYQILASSVTPTALEFFEKSGLAFASNLLEIPLPNVAGDAFLLLTVDGSAKECQEQIENLKKILKDATIRAFNVLNEKEAKEIWQLRGAIVSGVEAISIQEPLDIVVPINQITTTILYMKKLAQQLELAGVFFGHAGDGNIHACIMRQNLSDSLWQKRLESFLNQLYREIAVRGGLPSAEHGIGLLKKKYFMENLSPAKLKLMQQIKATFDPLGVLNPGKIFD